MSYCVVAVFYYQDIDAEGRLCGLGLVLRVRHEDFDVLLRHGFYGASKKQGVSVRMPLSACNPTRLCAGACYAHDVLDAVPHSAVRGAVNGIIAERFEHGQDAIRQAILSRLQPQTRRALDAALQEVRALGSGWTRRPYIRFSHVGEIAAFPQFANGLARQVRQLSDGEVDCVVYTRHPRARDLDPELLVINFTLDKSSHLRKSWAPARARIVFSAFGGELSPVKLTLTSSNIIGGLTPSLWAQVRCVQRLFLRRECARVMPFSATDVLSLPLNQMLPWRGSASFERWYRQRQMAHQMRAARPMATRCRSAHGQET